MDRFWYKWPSWVTELVAGAALVFFLLLPADAVLKALVASAVYELVFDRNEGKPDHKPWKDFGQRFFGILVGVALFYLIFNGQ